MDVRTFLIGVSAALMVLNPAFAEQSESQSPVAAESAAAAQASDPVIGEVRSRLTEATAAKGDERDKMDRQALTEYYAAHTGGPLWVTPSGLKPEAVALIAEITNADAYGLDTKAFKLPEHENAMLRETTTDALANAEIQISTAALLYARHARGGRIPDPAAMLNSNLDRRPQWIEPKVIIEALATAPEAAAAYLVSLHPKQPQFERLRQAYLAELAKSSKGPLNANAKRLRANMEMWRWMWLDMGDLYVLNNIPEFMQYVYKDGVIIRSEKIVAGMLDKQSSIFSRPLKHVVLRPAWRVPESIMVHELWPSLLRGGGLMRQYGLQIQTKHGEPRDWRKIDWSKDDIRRYDVLQPPGRNSVLGTVKFSFPSQHTIFMHDTPDKWMFRQGQRTLSHGCLRVQNPMALAEIILKEDKGWDAKKVADVSRSGPLNNEIAIDKEIPIHLVYFTAWIGDDGKVKTFRDVYGHEKRITQALDGQWSKINKGRNHLAKPQPTFDPQTLAARDSSEGRAGARAKTKEAGALEVFGNAFGLTF